MRPVVPAGEDPGRRRPGLLAAGAGGGGLVLSLHHRPDGAVTDHTGSAGRDLVVAGRAAGGGAAAAGLGQRGRLSAYTLICRCAYGLTCRSVSASCSPYSPSVGSP